MCLALVTYITWENTNPNKYSYIWMIMIAIVFWKEHVITCFGIGDVKTLATIWLV